MPEAYGFKVTKAFIDHGGNKYYNLTIGELHSRHATQSLWLWTAKCDCGAECIVPAGDAKRGKVQSCGCLGKKNQERFTAEHQTHGMAGSVEQKAWKRIIQRCTNPNSQDFSVYSKIGLSETIKSDFTCFYNDIGPAPEGKVSVDRIDNTKGYVEGNLRWATDAQQARNKGMYNNNSSGVTGVRLHTASNGKLFWCASWYPEKGKQKNKSFSVNKYGDELAFFAACECRDLMMQRLNLAGAGYSENHGKGKE